jgi:hypothetical protein
MTIRKEECCLPGCSAMLSGTNLKTFLRNLLPQPSGQKSKPCGNNRVRCADRQKGHGSADKPIIDRGQYSIAR